MKQKTAVEFIALKLRTLIDFNSAEERKQYTIFIKQAKEIEKEQTLAAYLAGVNMAKEFEAADLKIKNIKIK